MEAHHRKLARSAGVLGGLTAVSRVLGFVRDMVIATAFGTGMNAEAFVVSFKIPNLLRDLVGEGAANSAFVPVLTETHEKRKEEFWGLVNTLFASMTIILSLLMLAGIVFAPVVVKLIAPGFSRSADSGKFDLTVHLTRVMFPYILLIGLSALAMGVLNSLKEFASSALGPILLNISMIIAGYFFEPRFGPMALVIGVLCGGVLQLTCQVSPLFKKGFHFTAPKIGHGAAKKIGKLLLPRALGSALYQINVFVDSILASFESIVGPGGQSALYYSNRLFQLPLAIFGVSLAQALLPTFSTQVARNDKAGLKETFTMAVTTLMFIVMPASAGLVVLAVPIVRIIFQHGHFDAYSTAITSQALFFYGFGLLSCSLIKILVNAFYSMQDTRTPVKTTMFAVFLNVVFSLILMGPLKIGGLALASTLSATINLCMLYSVFRKRMGAPDEKKILESFIKILIASLLMAVFSKSYNHFILSHLAERHRSVQALGLFAGIASSVAFYVGLAWALKIEGLKKILSWRKNSSRTS